MTSVVSHIGDSVARVTKGNAFDIKSLTSTNSCRLASTVSKSGQLAQNAASNLDKGSKICPLVSECRKILEGSGKGDLQ